MAAKDIVEAFEKEYSPMDFFSNQQISQPYTRGWCAGKKHSEKNHDCKECGYFDPVRQVYTEDCYSCKRYYADMFTKR
jgi:hypothetical protein